MRFRQCKQEETGVDLTPFIDVVFMLLLFFVVSTSFYKGMAEIDVQLPEANGKVSGLDNKSIKVAVDAKGNYTLNGKELGNDLKQLKSELAQIAKKESLPIVVIGDRIAPYQSVVHVLAVAGECGLTQVQIMAQEGT